MARCVDIATSCTVYPHEFDPFWYPPCPSLDMFNNISTRPPRWIVFNGIEALTPSDRGPPHSFPVFELSSINKVCFDDSMLAVHMMFGVVRILD